MAEDNNFKDLVKSMKANTEMATHNNDAIMNLNKTFSDYFTMLSRQTKDQEENSRESKKSTRVAKSSPKDHFGLGNNSMNFLGGFAGVGKTIALVTAGVASFGLAFAGLRGWELGAIKSLKTFSFVPDVISNGVRSLRNRALAIFGLTAKGEVIRAGSINNGRFGIKSTLSLSEQIGQKIRSLRAGALAVFGISADQLSPSGKIAAQKGGDFIKGGGKTIGFITTQVGRILKPLTDVGAGIAKYIGGTGSDVMASIAKFGGSAGAWLGIVGKIFKPIGIIFSLKAAFDKFMESDKDLAGATGEGIAGFFSDFLGAPLDLLKNLVAWVFKKIGWDSAADTLTNVSITDGLFEYFSTILAIPAAIFRFFIGMFKDPEEAVKTLVADVGDIAGTVLGWIDSFIKVIEGWLPSVDKIRGWFGLEPLEEVFNGERITQNQLGRIAKGDRNKDGTLSDEELNYMAPRFRDAAKLDLATLTEAGVLEKDAMGGYQFRSAMVGAGLKLKGTGYADREFNRQALANSQMAPQFYNSTTVGDTISIHKYQGHTIPNMTAVDRRQLNQVKNGMMQ